MKSFLPILFAVATVCAANAQSGDPTQFGPTTDLNSTAKDCLPAAMRVYHSLPGPPTCTWKRLLSARFSNGRPNHVYCIFSLGSQIYAYDNHWGSRKVFPADKSALSVARALDFQAEQGVYLDEEAKPRAITSATQTLIRKTGVKKSPRSTLKSKSRKQKPDPDRALQDVI